MLVALQLMGFELLELHLQRDPNWNEANEVASYTMDFAVAQQRVLRDNKLIVFSCHQEFSLTPTSPRKKKNVPKYKKLSYLASGYLVLPQSLAEEADGSWGRTIAINCHSIIFGVARGIILQSTSLSGGVGFSIPSLHMEEVFDRAYEAYDEAFFLRWLKTGEGNEEFENARGITYRIRQK